MHWLSCCAVFRVFIPPSRAQPLPCTGRWNLYLSTTREAPGVLAVHVVGCSRLFLYVPVLRPRIDILQGAFLLFMDMWCLETTMWGLDTLELGCAYLDNRSLELMSLFLPKQHKLKCFLFSLVLSALLFLFNVGSVQSLSC